MTDPKRFIFAKFKRSDHFDLMEAFLISGDREKVRTWTGSKEEAAKPPGEAVEPNKPSVTKTAKGFENLTKDFLNAMEVFYRLVPAISAFSPIEGIIQLHGAIYELIRKEGAIIEKDEHFEFFQVDRDLIAQIDRAAETVRAVRVGWNSLPNMLLMGLVSSYDVFLSKLIRLIFITKPETLSSSERNISFRDLVSLDSVEAARELVIEKEIETVIRKSHQEQITWLENKLGIPLTKELDVWPNFVELCERRNLFTHTDGKVSSSVSRDVSRIWR